MELADIKKKLKNPFRIRDKDKNKMEMTPYRDWRTLFIICSALIVMVMAGSGYIFIQIEKDELFFSREDDVHTSKTFDTKKLKNVVADFEKRAQDLEVLRAQPPRIVDPSQ